MAAALALASFACRDKRTASADRTAGAADQATTAEISSAAESVVLRLYDEHPEHPWNRVHRALFRSTRPISRSRCLVTTPRSCDTLPSPFSAVFEFQPGSSEYEESSSLFASPEVFELTAAPRFAEAMSALREAQRVPPGDSAVAALLLQHDLWQRFDRMDAALRIPDSDTLQPAPDSIAKLRLLRDEVGLLMHHLALPAAEIAKVPSNLDALSRAYPDLIGGINGAPGTGPWLEVSTSLGGIAEPPGSLGRDGTRHAMVGGYRVAFRRFVLVPDGNGATGSGAAWLQRALAAQPAEQVLPPGSRVVLMETPLVISAEAAIVPLPIISLVEARQVLPLSQLEGNTKLHLSQLRFDVLDTRRALLRSPGYPSGGLQRLAFDAPFPMGGTCLPSPLLLLPMHGVCIACHGLAGEKLTGTLSHGSQRLHVTRDPDLQVRASVSAKPGRPEFEALRALFRNAEPRGSLRR